MAKILVFGVGECDFSPVKNDGIEIKSYEAWKNMLRRCYEKAWKDKRPSYSGSSVSDEWLKFSTFKRFYDENFVDGYVLDKDLLKYGNKMYSSGSCVFIPQELNKFITFNKKTKGECPIGVCKRSDGKAYCAAISINGKTKHMGSYKTSDQAHEQWLSKKIELAYGYKDLCDRIHPELFNGLITCICMSSGDSTSSKKEAIAKARAAIDKALGE